MTVGLTIAHVLGYHPVENNDIQSNLDGNTNRPWTPNRQLNKWYDDRRIKEIPNTSTPFFLFDWLEANLYSRVVQAARRHSLRQFPNLTTTLR